MIAAADILVALRWTAPPHVPEDCFAKTPEQVRADLMAMLDVIAANPPPRQFKPEDKIRIILPPL